MNKYFARPITIDGQRFASHLEGRRYNELVLLQRAGHISDLQLQVAFPLRVNNQLITTYVADFTYTTPDGKYHVEDTKGILTSTYKLKKKLMAACLHITIEEVRA